MYTFSFSLPIDLKGTPKWLSAVTSFEACNYVVNITDENSGFSIFCTRLLGCDGSNKGIQPSRKKVLQSKELLELRSYNFIELHVKEVNRRRHSLVLDQEIYHLGQPVDSTSRSMRFVEIGGIK